MSALFDAETVRAEELRALREQFTALRRELAALEQQMRATQLTLTGSGGGDEMINMTPSLSAHAVLFRDRWWADRLAAILAQYPGS